MDQALTRFLRYHRGERNSSPATIRYYRQNVELFQAFLSAHKYPDDPKQIHIDYVREWIEAQRLAKLSDVSIATRVRAITIFFRWLHREEWIDKNPLERLTIPRFDKKMKIILSDDDIVKLLESCKRNTIVSLRDQSLILIGYGMGLRASEVLNLRVRDVDFKDGVVVVEFAKSRRYRVVPMGPKVERSLEKYIAAREKKAKRNLDDDSLIFVNEDGDPLVYQALRSAINRRGEKCGVKVTYHLLRHSFATAFIRNGGSPATLKDLLGHATIQQSMEYLHQSGRDLSAQFINADPTKNLKIKI